VHYLPPGSIADQADVDGLRSLATPDHIDSYSLAFRQTGEATAVERRGMHENVLAAAVADVNPNPLSGLDHFTVPISSTAA
jgi:hypothetical protein